MQRNPKSIQKTSFLAGLSLGIILEEGRGCNKKHVVLFQSSVKMLPQDSLSKGTGTFSWLNPKEVKLIRQGWDFSGKQEMVVFCSEPIRSHVCLHICNMYICVYTVCIYIYVCVYGYLHLVDFCSTCR